jgi:hypothetical protein
MSWPFHKSAGCITVTNAVPPSYCR